MTEPPCPNVPCRAEALTHALREREKELGLIHAVAALLADPSRPLVAILAGVVERIPAAWQYPELTAARVTLFDADHTTANYAPSPWVQRAPIQVGGRPAGSLEVVYLGAERLADDSPFLDEERALLATVAALLGHAAERDVAERERTSTQRALERANARLSSANGELAAANQQLAAANQQLAAGNQQLRAAEQQLRAANDQLYALVQQLELAEAQARRGEARARALLDAVPSPMAVVALDEDVVHFWNAEARRLFGRAPSSKSAWYASAYPDPAYRAEVIARSRALRERAARGDGVASAGEFRITCEDGRDVSCEVQAAVVGGELIVGFHDVTEQRAAERAAREQAALLQAALDCSTAGIVIAEAPAGTLRYVNRAALAIRGDTPERLVDGVRPPAYVDRWQLCDLDGELLEEGTDPLAVALRDGQHVSRKLLMRRADGPPRAVWASAAPIRDDDGSVVAAIVVFPDITDALAAEAAARRSEERFRATFEQAPVGIAHVGLDGRWQRVNERLCRMVGYSQAELASRTFQSITHPEDADADDRVVRQLLAGEISRCELEKRYLRRDDTEVWVHLTGALIRDDAGEPDYFVAVMQDISERRAAERRYRDLVDGALDGILTMDAAGRLTSANRALVELLGRSESELVGRRWDELLADDLRGALASRLTEARSAGKARFGARLPRRDGATAEAEVAVQPLAGGAGSFVAFVRDVTEQRLAAVRLTQADRLASLGMLAAGVAHEINNPLTYVSYALDCLDEALPPLLGPREAKGRAPDAAPPESARDRPGDERAASEALTHLRNALDGTRRIREIARGLSTFARVDRDERSPVDLRVVIEAATRMASNEIRFRARLVKELAPVRPILASEGQLSQVFLNLVINAAHAIPDGAVQQNTITVRTWESAGWVYGEVSDTGHGIAADVLPRLFEPFFTTKQRDTGSGLGLTISRRIVESFGGSIDVETEVGVGSRFVVRLPWEQTPAPPPVREQPERAQAKRAGRVLVVDDERPICTALLRMLRGYQAEAVASGAEAQRLLEAGAEFDLIVCDVMMTDVSGVELHQWLAQRRPELADQVIFITGGVFTPGAREYLAQLSNPQLEKPFDRDALLTLVAELIARRRGE